MDFNNDSDYRNAGIGINRNNNYLSLFNGVFFAPTRTMVGKFVVMMTAEQFFGFRS